MTSHQLHTPSYVHTYIMSVFYIAYYWNCLNGYINFLRTFLIFLVVNYLIYEQICIEMKECSLVLHNDCLRLIVVQQEYFQSGIIYKVLIIRQRCNSDWRQYLTRMSHTIYRIINKFYECKTLECYFKSFALLIRAMLLHKRV